MSEISIRVENLSKRYQIGAQRIGRATLRETMSAPFRRARRLLRGQARSAADLLETFWALSDISFEVNQGEILGVVGANGAGKSTLLKILSRITLPTQGRAETRGRVGSLLEVGTGFHPQLTGRENVYFNGSILGMNRAEIARKFDEIVAFAGIEQFIDTPVKFYSSGMHVRLAFAVAAHLEPNILLVDEVLAVGDATFQQKCLGKMGEVSSEGRTVLYVSHNMASISRLCTRALWLDHGCLQLDGPAEDVLSEYLSNNAVNTGVREWPNGVAESGVDELKIYAVRIRNSDGAVSGVLDVRRPFFIEIEYRLFKHIPRNFRVGVVLTSSDGIDLFDSYDVDNEALVGPREPGHYVSRCEVPGNLLKPGRVVLTAFGGMWQIRQLAMLRNVLTLDIEDLGGVGTHFGGKRVGVIRPELEWQMERLA